ncbi:hypothetical protein BpHYR1_049727 [Brachionus plicatilis]|uniref:Uncharacterized protein n=1 Tax=Brachionus plicatilis TaxID=10195 RepID=A0A3M7QJ92_BRAPC|nr:hypothetical protein BpHYR1_049727 [Brachionus plicatilis]
MKKLEIKRSNLNQENKNYLSKHNASFSIFFSNLTIYTIIWQYISNNIAKYANSMFDDEYNKERKFMINW